jgi:hypothetical protein
MKLEDFGLKIHLIIIITIFTFVYIINPSMSKILINTVAIMGMIAISLLISQWLLNKFRQAKY